jgi:hypothetical protein
VYETLKMIRKRNGYDIQTLETLDNLHISDIKALAKYGNELCALTSNSLYSLSSSLQKWSKKGTVFMLDQDSRTVVKNANEQMFPTCTIVENLLVTSWQSGSAGVQYSVQDLENNSFLASEVTVDSNGTRPIVVSVNNSVYIFYASGSQIRYKKFGILQPSVLSSSVLVVNNLDVAAPLFDVHSAQNRIVIAYNSSVASDKLAILSIDQDDNLSSVLNINNTDASSALDITTDLNFRVIIAWADSSAVYYTIYSLALTSALKTKTTIETITNVKNVTAVSTNTDAQYKLYYEVRSSADRDALVKQANFNLAGTVSGIQVLKRSVGLVSSAINLDGTILVPVIHASSLQPTCFLLDSQGSIVTKFLNQEAGVLNNFGVLPHTRKLNNSKMLIVANKKNRLSEKDEAVYSTLGVNYQVFDFSPRNNFQTINEANNLHIASGYLQMYDGVSVSEHGFNIWPEDVSLDTPILTTVEVITAGNVGASSQQLIKFSAVPTQGTYTLTLGTETTSPLSFDATNASIKSVLEALPSVTNVTVTGSYSAGINILFNEPKQNFPVLQVTNNSLLTNAVVVSGSTTTEGVAPVKEQFKLNFSSVPNAGNFTIDIGGNASSSIAFNATNAQIKTAIESIPSITTATVTGSFSAGIVVTIDDPIQEFPTPTIASNTLTAGGNPVTIFPSIVQEGITGVKEVQRITFSQVPVSGNWTITVAPNTTSSLAFNANAAAIKSALEALANVTTATVTGDYANGFTVTIDSPVQNFTQFTFPTNTLLGNNAASVTTETTTLAIGSPVEKEVQKISFNSTPQSGTFKLKLGSEISNILNFTANAAAIKAELEAFTALTAVSVVGSMSSGFTITFDNPVLPTGLLEVVQNNLAETSTSLGNMSDGNYGYVATYRWTDNTGQDHVSSPTLVPLNVTLDRGTTTQSIRLKIPTLRLTQKQNVIIDIYRTEDSGTTYYKVTDDSSPLFNDTSVDYVYFLDTQSDDTIINNEVLYTTGGIVENTAPGSATLLCAYNNRIAIVGEERNRVYYSKINESGFPIEFSDLFYTDFSAEGGRITSMLQMNDKLIVFTEDACYYVAGDPPNNANQQSTLTSPETISTDIGCTDTNSVVLTPGGIMFKSRKGIYMLTNGLSLEYVGARVEAFNGESISSALVVGELNQIRFTTKNNIALVYNYELDKWAVFTNHGARSAVVIRNDYYYVREDGTVYKENRQSFSDASSPIRLRIETGWLSLGEIQGFQRVYHALILGSYRSPHKLNVKVAYDFIDAWTQQETIDINSFISDNRYGEDSPYGDSTTYGGDGSLYQMRVNFARQKCQSIKLLIEDAQDQVGEGLNLSTITLRAGLKQGTNKLGAERKFGTSGD